MSIIDGRKSLDSRLTEFTKVKDLLLGNLWTKPPTSSKLSTQLLVVVFVKKIKLCRVWYDVTRWSSWFFHLRGGGGWGTSSIMYKSLLLYDNREDQLNLVFFIQTLKKERNISNMLALTDLAGGVLYMTLCVWLFSHEQDRTGFFPYSGLMVGKTKFPSLK